MDVLEKKYMMGMIWYICIIALEKAKTWEEYFYLFFMTKVIFIRDKTWYSPLLELFCFRLTSSIYVYFGNNNNGFSVCTPLLLKNFDSSKFLNRSLGFSLICIDLTMQTRECLQLIKIVCVFGFIYVILTRANFCKEFLFLLSKPSCSCHSLSTSQSFFSDYQVYV